MLSLNKIMPGTALVSPYFACGLDRVKETPCMELAATALREFTQRRLNIKAEFINAQSNLQSRHACERMRSTVKFFFDYDKTELTEREPAAHELDDIKREVEDEVASIMLHGVGVEDTAAYTIHTAQRHGYVAPGKFKTSFRVFVTGFKTDPYSIKAAIQIAARKTGKRIIFDMSVYSKNRRLCMVLGCKSKEDTRILTPCIEDTSSMTEEDVLNFIVQDIHEDWPVKHVDPHADYRLQTTQPRRTEKRRADDRAEEAGPSKKKKSRRRGEDEAEEEEASEGEDEDTTVDEDMFDTIKDVLRDAGFVGARQVGNEKHDGKSTYVPFDCDMRHDCPICHGEHEHNMWDAHISKTGGLAVANHSDKCFKVNVMGKHFLHPFITDILDNVNAHMHYVQCYLDNKEGTVLFNEGTNAFHEFKTQQWKKVPDQLIMESMRKFMAEQLLDPQLAILRTWTTLAKRLKFGEKVMDRLNHIKKVVTKSRNDTGSYPFLVNLIKLMRGMCFADATLFDRQHNLLHFTNGALDLDTMELREAVPTDYNTFTTKYEYKTDVEEEDKKLHEEFINKVYPDPGHREAAQRVLGSTLTGLNTGKKLYIFTDNGGEFGGNNGKTKVFGLHFTAMGDYGVMAKKDFLYDSQSSAEGASPFMVKLASKRAVIVEELEPSKKLAEGTVKEMTNGTNALINVRDLYKSGGMIELCAKIMVGCNHGKFPRYDPYDEALTNRFLPVPHISHFTSDDSKLDSIKHVYKMDADIGDRVIKRCVTAHMLWCLEGYKRFKQFGLGLDTMPPSITEFKRIMLFKNTPVYVYLGEVLEDTGDKKKDILDMALVWDMYKKDKRSNRYLTMEQFEMSFKVYVNSQVSNSFQYVKTTTGKNSSVIARGFKIKPQINQQCASFDGSRDLDRQIYF